MPTLALRKAPPSTRPAAPCATLQASPLIEKLATLENDRIVEALTTPVPMMAGVVGGLTEQDKRDIAVYLTKKSMPAKGDLPEVKAE